MYVDTNVVYPYWLGIRQGPLLVSWDNYLTISSIHCQLSFILLKKERKPLDWLPTIEFMKVSMIWFLVRESVWCIMYPENLHAYFKQL